MIAMKLTPKEAEIMNIFLDNGAMFIKELLTYYNEPKPHYNTLSTMVRLLEEKGFIDYKKFGNTYQYFAKISKEDYRKSTMNDVVGHFFDNSFTRVVSSFIEEAKISLDELKDLIKKREAYNK